MGLRVNLIVTMVQRLTYRRRHSYATKSNKVRKVKTPGGVLTFHNIRKHASGIKCGDCGKVLQGLPQLRPYLYKRIPKNKKSLTRASSNADRHIKNFCSNDLRLLTLPSEYFSSFIRTTFSLSVTPNI